MSEWELTLDAVYDTLVIVGPKGKTYKAAVIPDAMVQLQTDKGRRLFFLELERGTVIHAFPAHLHMPRKPHKTPVDARFVVKR